MHSVTIIVGSGQLNGLTFEEKYLRHVKGLRRDRRFHAMCYYDARVDMPTTLICKGCVGGMMPNGPSRPQSTIRTKTGTWLSSGEGTPCQIPSYMRAAFSRPSSSFGQLILSRTATLFHRVVSQLSILGQTLVTSYLPKNLTCRRLQPKPRFQKSNWDKKSAQSRIHTGLRASLSRGGADYAGSRECVSWTTRQTGNEKRLSSGFA